MSERVLPTEPGWWYVRTEDGLETVQNVLLMQDGLYAVRGCCEFPEDVRDVKFEWLEPVAPLGTAACLAAAEAELAQVTKERDAYKRRVLNLPE